jgi:uncharacterized protein YjeT (DUF2065 family)
MDVVMYVLGLSWIAAGAILILYTDESKNFLSGLVARLGRLWLAMIPAGFGLLLLIAASSTTHSGFIGVIAFLGILKGFLIYFNPGGILETGKKWLDTLSDHGYRLIGIISLVLGTVFISWIR